MANELDFDYITGAQCYVLLRNRTSQIWSTSGGTGGFANYLTTSFADYALSAAEQGTASAHYAVSAPTALPAGVYGVSAKQRVGGSPAETDPTVATETFNWNGTGEMGLSDLATSGQVSDLGPGRLAYGQAVPNFPLFFKSSADHITPLTSGVISGTIARDGGAFGPLQSGAYTETGYGFFNLLALTSGDLAGKTIKLVFFAAGISGGAADPLPMSLVTYRSSGN